MPDLGRARAGSRPVRASIVLVAVLVLAAGLLAAPAFASGPPPGEGEGGKKAEGKDKKMPKNVLEFESLTVNLADQGGKNFVRLAFLIEFVTPADAESFNMAKARDAVIFLLSRMPMEEIWDGKQKQALKMEIINKFNEMSGKKKVAKIYFTDFIVK